MAAPKKGSKSSGPVSKFKVKGKVTRKGIHAKTKMSKNKGSKNYVKVSRGQGWKGETLFGAALVRAAFFMVFGILKENLGLKGLSTFKK